MPSKGLEEKEIGFLLILSQDGNFLRFEDCRDDDKKHARKYFVKQHVGRTSAPVANYLYDNSAYVLGFSDKSNGNEQLCFNTFKEKIAEIAEAFPDNRDVAAVKAFYENSRETILDIVSKDSLWEEITKNLSKKYSTFSFRINSDVKILAEKKEILQLEHTDSSEGGRLCLVSGKHGTSVETTTATMIPGSQATAKLVAFQIQSGYDSYGKTKCGNAPISEDAEFAYTTALNTMLQPNSRNKFLVGNRTFLFWASSRNGASIQAEGSLFAMLGVANEATDNPNANIMKARRVFESIYSGELKTGLDDRFYILGLAPNSARIAVVYWSECPLKDFAEKILRHFDDMEIHDTRKDKWPYMGIRDMIASVTLEGRVSDATPNLTEAVVKSIFQGLPYPATLFTACIRRIRAEQKVTITRAAIIKAYLNRQNHNNKKIEIMLDKENSNHGYLCGRLFAVLEKIQEEANHIRSIRERYLNAASATPATVFPAVLNLSIHHSEKLDEGRKIYFEKLKQEIINKISGYGFPSHLDIQDQGRFFIGYYHQRQDFFTSRKEQ